MKTIQFSKSELHFLEQAVLLYTCMYKEESNKDKSNEYLNQRVEEGKEILRKINLKP